MKKIILAFLATGVACAALGIILGKKRKVRLYDAKFDDEDDVDEVIYPDIDTGAMDITESEAVLNHAPAQDDTKAEA